jgi:hypothetical protein
MGRRAHPLRRPGHLGLGARPVVVARRHDTGHGQLRGRVRPRPTGSPRLADRAHGRRRGHPRHGTGRGDRVGVGDVPRVSRRAREAALDRGRRHPGAARSRAGLRHGRARRPQRGGHGRGHRGDAGHRARGRPGRRARILHLAHLGAPRHRRRAGAGDVRRRGRAVRPRVRAGRGRRRCLRARPAGLGRRDARGRLAGGRLDAPALGRHRPSRLLRAAPARRRPRVVAQAAGGIARGLRRGGPAVPPDRRPAHGDRLGPPHHGVPVQGHAGLQGAAGPVLVGRRTRHRAGRPRGAAVDSVVDAIVAGRGGGDGEGVPAHLRAR